MSEFTVILPAETWNKNTGWFCTVLSIPGAKLRRLIVEGHSVPLDEVEATRNYIRPIRQSRAQDAAATFEISKRLVTFDTTIVVALIGLVGTLTTAMVSYVLGKSPDAPLPAPPPPEPGYSCWGDGGQHTDYHGLSYGSRFCETSVGGNVVSEGTVSGYLHPGKNWFICQEQWKDSSPKDGAQTRWWLYTQADTGDDKRKGWGWFPATNISGADDSRPIPGLRYCDSIPNFPKSRP